MQYVQPTVWEATNSDVLKWLQSLKDEPKQGQHDQHQQLPRGCIMVLQARLGHEDPQEIQASAGGCMMLQAGEA